MDASDGNSDNLSNFYAATKIISEILSQIGGDNSCAKFFKGMGSSALNVIQSYVDKAQERVFFAILNNSATGIRMTMDVHYLLEPPAMSIPTINNPFSVGLTSPGSIVINSNGLFVKSVSPKTGSLPSFGGYSAGTIGSRVIQVLHEMGHLIVTEVRNPTFIKRDKSIERVYPITLLLDPDGDPNDTSKSEENTDKIVKACGSLVTARIRRK